MKFADQIVMNSHRLGHPSEMLAVGATLESLSVTPWGSVPSEGGTSRAPSGSLSLAGPHGPILQSPKDQRIGARTFGALRHRSDGRQGAPSATTGKPGSVTVHGARPALDTLKVSV